MAPRVPDHVRIDPELPNLAGEGGRGVLEILFEKYNNNFFLPYPLVCRVFAKCVVDPIWGVCQCWYTSLAESTDF